MKKILSTVKEKMVKGYAFAKKHTLALVSTLTAAATALAPSMSVYAATTTTAATTNSAEGALINAVLGVIFKLFRYIGILLLAWSIGMLVLAFKNEDADSKSRSIMLMVVSVVLITVEPIINGVLTAAGITL